MESSRVFVSVVIPCRNEERFIGRVLSDLIAQDYPKNLLEAFVMDGRSDDNTPQIIREISSVEKWIHYRVNESRFVPAGLNAAIRESKGSIIIRMDAHASYPSFYISKLVDWLVKLDADNVGGIWKTSPSADTIKSKAIAIALAHKFGVGNADFRLGIDKPQEADTVPFGCFRRDVFDRFGFYNEKLIRNQDIELNKRIKSGGGKVILVPDVHCIYFARDTFDKLAKNNFQNGRWAILTPWYTGTLGSLSVRHFVPLGFVLYFIFSIPFSFISTLFLIPAVIYLLANIYFSSTAAIKNNNFAMMPFISWSFIVLHFSYGWGSIAGLFKFLFAKK
jgi:glycosyltransferase involved in cell wall biosynthesis